MGLMTSGGISNWSFTTGSAKLFTTVPAARSAIAGPRSGVSGA